MFSILVYCPLCFLLVGRVLCDEYVKVVDIQLNTTGFKLSKPSDFSPIDGSQQYGNNFLLTRNAGATASYKFNGTGISVHCTQATNPQSNRAISTYTIDGSSAYQYEEPIAQLSYHQQFFTSANLSNGEHELVIKNINQGGWLWLDYLQVTVDSSTSTSSSTSGLTLPSPGNDNDNYTSSSATGLSAGTIVGISIAGVTLLATICGLWLWRNHREKRVPQPDFANDSWDVSRDSAAFNSEAHIVPFMSTSLSSAVTSHYTPIAQTSDECPTDLKNTPNVSVESIALLNICGGSPNSSVYNNPSNYDSDDDAPVHSRNASTPLFREQNRSVSLLGGPEIDPQALRLPPAYRRFYK